MNKRRVRITLCTVIALIASSILAPPLASAQANRQKKKNNWRNAAAGAGAVAGYGLLKGNKTVGVLGVLGAAYSANRYEQERKSQAARRDALTRYRRHGRPYTRDGKKYYKYHGKMYCKNLSTGERRLVG